MSSAQPEPRWVTSLKEHTEYQLKTYWFSTTMVLLTIYALFGDDIRLAATTQEADVAFWALSSVALVMFSFELIMQFFARPEYRWNFYFWLDFVSTLSLVTDIGWLSEYFGGSNTDSASALKAGRTSRAGAKAGRVVRIVRLIRMVRIVKLFKIKQQQGEEEEEEEEEGLSFDRQPSKVSKKLTELTVQRIIVLILLMICFLPFIDQPEQLVGAKTITTDQRHGFQQLHKMSGLWNQTGDISKAELELNMRSWLSRAGRVLYLQLQTIPYGETQEFLRNVKFQKHRKDAFDSSTASRTEWNANKDFYFGHPADAIGEIIKDLRMGVEWGYAEDGDGISGCMNEGVGSVAIFDVTPVSQLDANLSIAKTCFVMVILTWAVIVFSTDAEKLVVEPIDRMISLVQKLAENPLGDLKAKKKSKEEEEAEATGDQDETVLLEATLSKISGLLQVGFGVAGAEVIGKSMSTENGTGDLNYMLPGKMISSVFGFAIIEEFTNTCSALEEQTCTYINTIASIVHQAAATFHGAPNKNIGCAFLMIWKICDGRLPGMRDLRDSDPPNVTTEFREWRAKQRENIAWPSKGKGDNVRLVPPQEMVESAVTSFLKVVVDLHHANHGGTLVQFCKHPGIIQEFGTDFQVHMGLGLHIGWAIEGTIGSRYKIDASYLSPNVNVAARLEAATHIFKTPLLVSGFIVDELSAGAKGFCRMVDCVAVKGSQVPLELWTFDVTDYPEACLNPYFDEDGKTQLPVDFVNQPDFTALQRSLDPAFRSSFNDAIAEYIAGNWKAAKDHVNEALKINPKDGPAKTLISVLAADKFVAPSDWAGYRALTSKT